MKSGILWEIRDISVCLRKCSNYCKLLTAQNTFLKIQFVALIFRFGAQFWLGGHAWNIPALGVHESPQFYQLQLSMFVNPVLLSLPLLKNLAQCKRLLRQSARQNSVIFFGMKSKSQEKIRSSHYKEIIEDEIYDQ